MTKGELAVNENMLNHYHTRAIKPHLDSKVASQTGAHGLRFFNDALEAYNEETGEWDQISAGGGGIPLDEPSDVSVTNMDEAALLKWTDPADVVVDGQTLASWAGTVVVRKVGSAPTKKNDGTVVVDSTVRDQYKTTGFTDTGLTNGVTYYYGFFPHSTTGTYTLTKVVELTPAAIYPTAISDLVASGGNATATVSFTTPADATRVKVVYKAGGAPTSDEDGTAVDNATSPVNITGLVNGTTYYFQAYTYNAKGRSTAATASASATPKGTLKMTVVLDLSDSNPETWATYADDAVGMTAGSSDWDEFFGHYPTLLKNGVENGKLDPSNRNALAAGGAADVTSGSAGDVMIAFPRHGLKITNDGSKITISMTDAEDDSNFDYYAHTYKGQRCDKFYLGAYKGVVEDSKLRSLSGKTVTANQTIGAFRTNAQANGDGYEQSGFFQLTYRQAMYLLKYKGQNAQIAVGRGWVDSPTGYATTGNTNTQPMDYGETTGKLQCCLFGLEDFWGNYYEFIDGVYCDASRKITVADGNFNDTGSGYIDSGAPATSADGGGYMNKANGTSLAGFTIAEGGKSGSETTYFCDYASADASRLAYFGGYRTNASYAGVFLLSVYRSASDAGASCAARLMFLHTAA